MPRRYNLIQVHGSMILDGTITTEKLANKSVTWQKVGPLVADILASRIDGNPSVSAYTTAISVVNENTVLVDFANIKYELNLLAADSRGMPNLHNPAFTAVNDGNRNTYNEQTTGSTTPVNALVKLDMGRVGRYAVYAEFATSSSTSARNFTRIYGSADDVTYTSLAGAYSGGTGFATWRMLLMTTNMRYFKMMFNIESSGSYATSRLYELAIFRLD